MADSTKAMRKSIVDRDSLPAFENRQLNEITADGNAPWKPGVWIQTVSATSRPMLPPGS